MSWQLLVIELSCSFRAMQVSVHAALCWTDGETRTCSLPMQMLGGMDARVLAGRVLMQLGAPQKAVADAAKEVVRILKKTQPANVPQVKLLSCLDLIVISDVCAVCALKQTAALTCMIFAAFALYWYLCMHGAHTCCLAT